MLLFFCNRNVALPSPFSNVLQQNVHKNREMETGRGSVFVLSPALEPSETLASVSSLYIHVVKLCPGSSPSETLCSEKPSSSFALLLPAHTRLQSAKKRQSCFFASTTRFHLEGEACTGTCCSVSRTVNIKALHP